MRKYIITGIVTLALFVGIFCAGYFAGLDAGKPGFEAARVEMERARSDLESARNRSDELGRGLDQAQGIARSSIEAVDSALGEAGRIKDAGKRIVYLVGEIRKLVDGLRRIAEQGTSAPLP